jgi:DNA-binding response OmpR family regulator
MAELNADPGRFRAVITDINLGTGPDGWDVGRRVRELVPGMPVVYLSGESSKDWPNRGVPCSLMLAKPFPPAQLVVAIVSLTGTPPPGLSDRDPRT